jgi:hypothetical protein
MSQTQTPTLAEKVVDYVGYSSVALEKAAAAEAAREQDRAKCAGLIPQVVDVMVEHDRIEPGQRDELAEKLASHENCLELMVKLAGHRNASEMSHLGQAVRQRFVQ